MKIGILTFSKVYNYGGNLQCYALKKYLESQGNDVFVIDLKITYPSSLLSKIIRIPRFLKFNDFWKNQIIDYTEVYNTLEELYKNPPHADLFIVGSDQVWNPEITKKSDPLAYFFPYVATNEKKISYAASFGEKEWKYPEIKEEVKNCLSNFDGVSVREPVGVKICKESFNTSAEVVCDPVFLLDDYKALLERYPAKETNEIVYFRFTPNPKVEKTLYEFSRKHKLKVVHLNVLKTRRGFEIVRFPSVEEWLSRLNNAAMVVTDSFHCTAFSILFHKKYVSMSMNPRRRSRHENIVSHFNMHGRFYDGDKNLMDVLEYSYSNEMPDKEIDTKVLEWRSLGRGFLSRFLI